MIMSHGKAFIEIEAVKEAFLRLVGTPEFPQDEAAVEMQRGVQGLFGQSFSAQHVRRCEIARVGSRADLAEQSIGLLGTRKAPLPERAAGVPEPEPWSAPPAWARAGAASTPGARPGAAQRTGLEVIASPEPRR